MVLLASVADPGSGAFLTSGSGIRDGYNIRIRIRDEHPGSYSESLETIFWVKIGYLLKIFDADPGWNKFGSGINIPDL